MRELGRRRKRSEALEAQVEREEMILVVEAFLLGRVEGEGDLATIGRDVVVVRSGIRARQLESRSGEKVAGLPGFDVDHEEVRNAPVRKPVVPPSVRPMLDHV